jgi:hypothetical protein
MIDIKNINHLKINKIFLILYINKMSSTIYENKPLRLKYIDPASGRVNIDSSVGAIAVGSQKLNIHFGKYNIDSTKYANLNYDEEKNVITYNNVLNPYPMNEINYQNLSLFSNQSTLLSLTDSSNAKNFYDTYIYLYNLYKNFLFNNSTYPVLQPDYYKWFISGYFPENSTIFSDTDIGYTIPTISPTTSSTPVLAAGGSATVIAGTFVSGTQYITQGTSGFTQPIKDLLETPSGNWKDITNKTANGIILYQYNVTASLTFTVNNIIFKNVLFNFSNTTNLALTFVGNNITFENCIFNVPRNDTNGSLFFDVTGAGTGILIKNCVIRNTAATVVRPCPIAIRALASNTNIVVQNNWMTLNYPTTDPNGITRFFFAIPSVVTGDVLGDIYIVDNNFENIGFANGQAYTDGSEKGFFAWDIQTARTYTFKAYIDNNTFTNTTVFNDFGLVAVVGAIPASFIGSGLIYIKNSDIPDTYKKIMVYNRQTLDTSVYNSPIFYTV